MNQKILLVEDDQPTIEILEEALKMAGFEIETAISAKEAMEKLKQVREGKKEKPDLILLDLILPDMNGIEVLKEAKKYPQTKDIKIFALTNYTESEMNKQLIKEGIDKIILKSQISLDWLIETIKNTLKQK